MSLRKKKRKNFRCLFSPALKYPQTIQHYFFLFSPLFLANSLFMVSHRHYSTHFLQLVVASLPSPFFHLLSHYPFTTLQHSKKTHFVCVANLQKILLKCLRWRPSCSLHFAYVNLPRQLAQLFVKLFCSVSSRLLNFNTPFRRIRLIRKRKKSH